MEKDKRFDRKRGRADFMQGLGWMALSMVSFISMAVGSRELASTLSIRQVLFFRALVGLGVILLVGRSLLPQIRQMKLFPRHLARNAVHFTAQYFWTIGVVSLPLASVFALEFTMPIWVALFAWLLLKEKLTGPRLLATLGGFIGVLVVVRPGHGVIDPAAGFVLLAAAGARLSQNTCGCPAILRHSDPHKNRGTGACGRPWVERQAESDGALSILIVSHTHGCCRSLDYRRCAALKKDRRHAKRLVSMVQPHSPRGSGWSLRGGRKLETPGHSLTPLPIINAWLRCFRQAENCCAVDSCPAAQKPSQKRVTPDAASSRKVLRQLPPRHLVKRVFSTSR